MLEVGQEVIWTGGPMYVGPERNLAVDNGHLCIITSVSEDGSLIFIRLPDGSYFGNTDASNVGPSVREDQVLVYKGSAISRDEFAAILKAGHGSVIREADEWRPLVDHIFGLIAGGATVKEASHA